MQRRDPVRVRLDLRDPGPVDKAQAGDAVGPSPPLELLQARQLRTAARDDQLAAALAGNTPLVAERVHLTRPLHAQARLQRARAVIDTGVNDTGVVAGLVGAELALALEQAERYARVAHEQLARDGHSEDAAADDGEIAAGGRRLFLPGRH
jgi:hypothetical protein